MSIRERKICYFLLLYFIMEAANLFVKLFLGGLPFWGVVSKGILAIALIPALLETIRGKRDAFVFALMEIIFFAFFIITILIGKVGDDFIKNVIYVMGIYIPMGCCVCALENKDVLLKVLYKWHKIPILLMFITLVFFRDGIFDYSMSCSYCLLLWIIVIADHYINESKSVYDILALLFSVLLIIVRGSRGSLLCFFAFLFFSVWLKWRKITTKKAIVAMSVAGGIFIVFLNYYFSVFKWIYQILLKNGHQSRILWTLSYNITYDSGRSELYRKYIDLIKNQPLLGYGLFGNPEKGPVLPHNSILEVFFYFGIPLGIIIIISYLSHVIKLCRYNYSKTSSRCMIVIVSILVSTLFSNELMLSPFFYIGAAIAIREKVSKQRSEEVDALNYRYNGVAQ